MFTVQKCRALRRAAGRGREPLSISFIFEDNPSRVAGRLRMFEGLSLIGDVYATPDGHTARGVIHGETFECRNDTMISGMSRVGFKVYKFDHPAGSMNWSKSDLGTLQLFKKTSGANQFGIRPVEDAGYALSEKDGIQEVGRINGASKHNLIWTGLVTSLQRPKEQVHELMLYCVFLMGRALRV